MARTSASPLTLGVSSSISASGRYFNAGSAGVFRDGFGASFVHSEHTVLGSLLPMSAALRAPPSCGLRAPSASATLNRRIVATEADVRDLAGLAAVVDGGVAQLGRLDTVPATTAE